MWVSFWTRWRRADAASVCKFWKVYVAYARRVDGVKAIGDLPGELRRVGVHKLISVCCCGSDGEGNHICCPHANDNALHYYPGGYKQHLTDIGGLTLDQGGDSLSYYSEYY